MLKRLPTALRKKYEDFDVAVLLQIVPDLVTRNGSPGGDAPNPRPIDNPTSLKGLSGQQIQDLKNGNPELYQKLMREYAR